MSGADAVPELDAEQVAAWLAAHPRFFVGRDALLEHLQVPHEAGHAVSLVERQLRLLRTRNHELQSHLLRLMEVARENDRLFERSRRLIVALLEADSLEELVATIEDGLRHDFQVPHVSLLLFADEPAPVGRWIAPQEAERIVAGLLGEQKTVCGVLRATELALLFPGDRHASIGSAAVARLEYRGLHGVLALGSPDPQHYRSNLGTVFLGHVAEIAARRLSELAGRPLRDPASSPERPEQP